MSFQRPSQRPPQPRSRPVPSRTAAPRVTTRLRDLPLGDRDSAYYAPRMGDWLLLGILVAIFLGNGAYVWHQMGADSHAGRAIFFGLLLLCVLWSAIVYTFKLSVCVRVGPHGITVVRGPWRTELAWRDVARLTERSQVREGQRFRWLVALARDGRRMQIRDDMVLNYQRFRVEVYERYRMWNDHGGTWGTTGGGPYTAREVLPGQTTWYGVCAVALGLPGVYFLMLLPETDPLGLALIAAAIVCGALSVRSALQRQGYTVDGKAITVRRSFRTMLLPWSEVARVERTRAAFGGVIRAGIAVGQTALKLAARTDGRVESFDWAPRVPEYLILRGAGHMARIRLHRLERPDEMLAWVEFYDNVARHAAASVPRRTGSPSQALAELPQPAALDPDDLSSASGPVDPWGDGRGGEVEAQRADLPAEEPSPAPSIPTTPAARTRDATPGDSWLRAEPWADEARAAESPYAAYQDAAGTDVRVPEWQAPEDVQRVERSERTAWEAPAASVAPEQAFQPAREPMASLDGLPRHAQQTDWQPPQWRQHTAERHGTGGPSYAEPQAASESWHVAPAQSARSQPSGPTPKPEPEGPFQQAPASPSRFDDHDTEWIGDEVEPEAAEDAPTSPVDSLAESFAAWRDDATWQPPPLPRFGPPPDGRRDE